jgi:O-antigen biosynthesis protein
VTLHDLEGFGGPHHQALELLCIKALARGDIETAYRLSDRRCRIRPLAEAHCFVLRAEALHRMGERAAALADLEAAIQIAPDDLAANRRMLAWGETGQQIAAARTLIDHDRDERIRRRAATVLRANGQTVDEANAALVLPELPSPQLAPIATESDAADISADHEHGSVTVIVPVYGDHAATQACLEGLMRELDKESHHQAIVVNDASPDDRIRELIEGLAPRRNLRVLTNPRNLGFVGTINRALQEIPSGDVILLNADTIIPHDLIARLSAAARLSPDIGTVTPLSNNGEFTSFPLPNRSNAVGSVADIEALDRIAAQVNADGVIDIPNGIGFCLYITRRCLDAVGGLSEDYHRGYLEDVDFCLRARQRGFRHVCVTSIFVGHAGTRSFGKHKRSLVVRNLEIIERRFPLYRGECAVFMQADPLKAARQAIELAIPPADVSAVLLVTTGGTVAEIAGERARQLLSDGEPAVLILEIRSYPGRVVGRLRNATEAVPQSLEFDLPSSGAASELLSYLRLTKLSRMEFLDLVRIPRGVVATLLELPVPHDIFVAHTDLGLERRSASKSASASSPDERRRSRRIVEDPFFWSLLVASADRVLVPDAQAEAFTSRVAPRRNTIRLKAVEADTPRSESPDGDVRRLGLVPIRRGPKDHQLMRGLISGLKRAHPEIELVVAGSTSDDQELLRSSDVFVSGAVDAVELEALFRRYRFDRLMLCLTEPLFGHPILAAVMASVLPVAYFDWSRGRCPVRAGDLPLDPSQSTASAVTRLALWLQGQQRV